METIQDAMLNPEVANLDLSKVAALQQKRTLAFVNHFVMTTVQFLNSFMKNCEHQLMEFERKLEKVEAAMVLLEDRLSSIPEVNSPSQPKPIATAEQTDEHSKEKNTKTAEHIMNMEVNETNDTKHTSPIELQPEYDRFVKMVQVGVPLQAVKLKLSLEGLDPNVLEKILSK